MDTNSDFTQTKECIYKNDRYSVRDNGAILRHTKENKPKRRLDNIWTFGRPSKDGYLFITQNNQKIHKVRELASGFMLTTTSRKI